MALSMLLLFFAFGHSKKKRLIDDTPTSKAHGVFIGLVELSGTAETSSPVTSYLTERECVHYSWSISEHWSRTVTETYTDSQGKTRTRTKTESGWKLVASGSDMCKFLLRDETGTVQIRPEGAKIEGTRVMNHYCGPSDPIYYGKGPAFFVPNSDHRRSFTETIIPLGAELYVMGQAREREDVVAAEIAHDRESPIFIISTRKEKKVSRSYGLSYWAFSISGLAVILLSVFISRRLSVYWIPQTARDYVTAGLIYGAVWLIGWVWTVYNGLKALRERVRQGRSQVEVQFRRRSDLIPRLVSLVAGLMRHEQTVQTIVADLRTEMTREVSSAASGLMLLIEKYPDLKSSQTVLNLQRELTETENRIELARAYYNDLATFYNTRLERVPDFLIAKIAGLKQQELFKY
jgi:hypothetical protein